MNKEQVYAQDKAHYIPVFSRYSIVLSHGEGPYVYDSEGKKYLDFLAGIAVNILGHGHPGLVAAISSQAAKLIHCSNLYYTEQQTRLAARLADMTGMDKVFLGNSGAEANEGAIKLARKYGKTLSLDRIEIITAENSFHGRTYATLTATGQPKYREGYEPLPGGFRYIRYNDIDSLKSIISEKTCAVMLEPIQGEGGVNMPDPGYLQAVRDLCDQTGALLIFDEIQTGMGRTGKLLACQEFGVKPDIITLAKGLGGGVPIGAFLTTNAIAGAFHAGDHGSTFGGNPLAAAAANAVLDAVVQEDIAGNAAAMGLYFLDELKKLQTKYPGLIKEVRGCGLIIGMELTRPGREVVNSCLEGGAIINCTGGNILRFVPPLTINRDHIDELIVILDKVLGEFINV